MTTDTRQPIRVLMLEDSADDAELIVREMRRAGFEPDWRRVDTEAAFLEALEIACDVILADYALPRFDGLRALDEVRARGLDTPFLIVSGTMGEENAVEAIHRGATDYVMKDRLARLGSSLRRALKERRLRDERRRAETALHDSERRFRLLVEASPSVVLMVAADGRISFANQRVESMFGYAPHELIGRPVDDLLPHAARTAHAAHRSAYASHPTVRPMGRGHDLTALRKDGTRITVEVGLAPLEVDGRPYVMATVTDTTARLTAEAALRASEARKAAIFESALDALVTVDAAGVVVEWNRAAERVFGYAAADTIGMDMAVLVIPERLRDAHRRGMARYLVSGSGPVLDAPRTVTAARRSGEEFPAEIYISAIQADPPLFTAFVRDVTERERAQEAVKRLAAFPEVNPNPVLELTADGTLTYCNAAAVALAHDLGLPDAVSMLPKNASSIADDCLASGQERLRVQLRFGRRVISWAFYPIKDRSVVHGYAADITERLTLEDQLRQSQKLEAIGQLAGGVAHDFNNLLSVMLMQAEVAAATEHLPSDALEGLREIQACAERGAELTRQLLLFSRRQVMQPRELDLNDVVTGLAKMLQRIIGEDVRLELHLSHAPLVTRADAGMLDQVLLNLSVNARDAMPDGGRLVVETFAHTSDASAERPNPDAPAGPYVGLRVTDAGCGIPADVLPRIFEPFFTTKEAGKGTGLGLATVFGIVRQHVGWVNVTSEVGRGTTFEVLLPALVQRAVADDDDAPREVHGGHETLLVVEDERSVRTIVRSLLERRGYTVIEAASGVEALAAWNECGARVALVLTDLVMPDGVGGQELARRLRLATPGLRVVYTSGYSPDIAGRELTLARGERFLQKPFAAPMLLDAVRQALDERLESDSGVRRPAVAVTTPD